MPCDGHYYDYYNCNKDHLQDCKDRYGESVDYDGMRFPVEAFCDNNNYYCAYYTGYYGFYCGSGSPYRIINPNSSNSYWMDECLEIGTNPSCLKLREPRIEYNSCGIENIAIYAGCSSDQVGCAAHVCSNHNGVSIVDYLVCTSDMHGNLWMPSTETSPRGVYKVCEYGCDEEGRECIDANGTLMSY